MIGATHKCMASGLFYKVHDENNVMVWDVLKEDWRPSSVTLSFLCRDHWLKLPKMSHVTNLLLCTPRQATKKVPLYMVKHFVVDAYMRLPYPNWVAMRTVDSFYLFYYKGSRHCRNAIRYEMECIMHISFG